MNGGDGAEVGVMSVGDEDCWGEGRHCVGKLGRNAFEETRRMENRRKY